MRLLATRRVKVSRVVTLLCRLCAMAQQQKGDQRDRDLNAHGVLGTAEELGDFQRLLHHPEEQFDLPAALVEVGDLLRRRVEVVGEQAQPLAGFGRHDDLAHRLGHRIAAVAALPGGQEADAVADHLRTGRQRQVLGSAERRVGLEAGHQPAAPASSRPTRRSRNSRDRRRRSRRLRSASAWRR